MTPLAQVSERGLEEWALLCEEWLLGAGCRGGGRGAPSEAPSEAGSRARSLSASGLDTKGWGGGLRPPAGRRALYVAPGPAVGRPRGAGASAGSALSPAPAHILPSGSESSGCTPRGPGGAIRWPAPAWGLAMPSSSGWQPCRAGEKRPPGSSRQRWSHCSAGGFGEGPGRSQDPGGLREARAQTRGPPKDSEGLVVGKKPAAQMSLPLLLPTKPPP